MSPTKIWIDCSGSVDDTLALLILLDASYFDIVGISCVRGSTTTDRGIRNISKILRVCKRTDISLYRGANEPLTTPFPQLDSRHTACEDTAEVTFSSKKPVVGVPLASDSHASIHLADTARRMEGELMLVSLGPFTNIAIACALDPLFPLRIGKYVAAGCSEVGGDVTLTSEFNVYVDPEAAQLVLNKFFDIVLVTRDIGKKYAWKSEEEWLQKAETTKARLLEGIQNIHEEMEKKIEWIGHAAICAAVAVIPDLITETKEARCQVETVGQQTRGQSVFDFERSVETGKISANVVVVKEIDAIRFYRAFKDAVI